MLNEKGQTLMELVVVLAVSIIIIGALVFATISSLRNAQFAKNQSQATKLAQEGLERVRNLRDMEASIGGSFTVGGIPINSWRYDSDLWNIMIQDSCVTKCYFKFNGSLFQYIGAGTDVPAAAEDPLGDGKFKRAIILDDDLTTYTYKQKIVTVIVQWKDFSGLHESKLTTLLGRK